MKKKLLSLLALFAGVFVSVYAENTDISALETVVYINPVSAEAGMDLTLSVRMKNAMDVEGFMFDLYLPEGISVKTDADGYPEVTLSTERTTPKKTNSFDSAFQPDGGLRVLGASTNGSTISGNDGEIVQVVVTVNSKMEEGDYPIILKNISISDTEATSHRTEYVESSISVTEGDGRIKFDENAASLPAYTAGEKGNVTMTRTILGNQWNTIVLPFTLTKAKAEAIFGSDVQLAEFSGFNTVYSDDEDVTPNAICIHFTTFTMTTKKGMTGGKLFLVKTSQDITSFQADDVTLFDTVTDVSKSDEWETAGKFTGTLVKTKVPSDGLFISDDKFWYSTGKTNIKAFRGWFELGAVLDKETDFGARISFFVDQETTSIKDIYMSNSCKNGKVYTLSGQLIGDDTPSGRLPKGIYIVNGKKLSVK